MGRKWKTLVAFLSMATGAFILANIYNFSRWHQPLLNVRVENTKQFNTTTHGYTEHNGISAKSPVKIEHKDIDPKIPAGSTRNNETGPKIPAGSTEHSGTQPTLLFGFKGQSDSSPKLLVDYTEHPVTKTTANPQPKRDKPIHIYWYFLPRYLKGMAKYAALKACPNDGCFLVHGNVSYLNKSDAVIFSAEHITTNPPPRMPGQVWIYHNNEPPFLFVGKKYSKPPWSSAFNWTMDFRHDADIVRPYAMLRKQTTNVKKNFTDIVRKKKKIAAIMVSNCADWSGRIAYVKALNKSVPVDIYGGCGKRMFSRSDNSKWLKYLSTNYMFYLAFENLYCKDYISEKFFNNYNFDLVAVARGGGNYSRDVPSGTYINVADFENPKKLAEYLLYLKNNTEKYIEILKKKDEYYYETEEYKYIDPWKRPFLEHYYEQAPLCEVCNRLKHIDKYSKTISDINKWFNPGICHRHPFKGKQ